MAAMRLALGLASAIDRLTAALGRGAAWLALAIVLVQFGLVGARYVVYEGRDARGRFYRVFGDIKRLQ